MLPITLRKHVYSNILKIFPPIIENFQIKNPIFFHISAQNIDCGTYTPVNPSFYCIKVGFKEGQNYIGMFS